VHVAHRVRAFEADGSRLKVGKGRNDYSEVTVLWLMEPKGVIHWGINRHEIGCVGLFECLLSCFDTDVYTTRSDHVSGCSANLPVNVSEGLALE
jgi:hypothetical protein